MTHMCKLLELIDQEYSTLTLAKAAKELNFNKTTSAVIKEKEMLPLPNCSIRKIMMASYIKINNLSEKNHRQLVYSTRLFYKQLKSVWNCPHKVKHKERSLLVALSLYIFFFHKLSFFQVAVTVNSFVLDSFKCEKRVLVSSTYWNNFTIISCYACNQIFNFPYGR